MKSKKSSRQPIDFAAVNRAALAVLPSLLRQWLPGGRLEGCEYVALNPRRQDRRPGSFRVNVKSGLWADFACDARGRDVIALAAYLSGQSQGEAARNLGSVLGLDGGRRGSR